MRFGYNAYHVYFFLQLGLRSSMNNFQCPVFLHLLKLEWQVCRRSPLGYLFSASFFIFAILLFPLVQATVGGVSNIEISCVVVIVAALSVLLTSEHFFLADYETGVIDHWLLSRVNLSLRIYAKLYLHVFLLLFPILGALLIATPVLHLSGRTLLGLLICLSLVMPVVTTLSLCISAVCVSLKRPGLLLAILLLPLYIPILIYGCAIPVNLNSDLSIAVPVALLSASVLLAVSLGPLAIGGLLRIGIMYS